MKKFYTFIFLVLAAAVQAQTYHNLSSGPFTQNWTNTGLITANDNWTGVPSIQGYRGDNLTAATGTDPQTILADGFGTPLNVTANQTTPNTIISGGICEFEIADPVVAFQGSGTADAPFIVIFINTTGISNIRLKYNLRDIDGSADDAVQQVALQYRIGTTGDFTNIPAGYVADASTGPNLATLVTAKDLLLPYACDNQAQVQIRIITTNAANSDEFIGVDDIDIRQDPTAAVNNIIRNPNYVRIAGNPGGDLNIQFNQAVSSDVQIQFFSTNGEMVLQKRLGRITEGQVEKISLGHLPKGLYMLSIKSKEGTFTTKVVN
jgi:uncharacterized protein